mmetsp:Transcript_2528/g.16671  ORF Transcript_2528/g.16671 Transcript_2528/m.16671 type:complete len:217 (+) Transcript_2528:1500-2150(+)
MRVDLVDLVFDPFQFVLMLLLFYYASAQLFFQLFCGFLFVVRSFLIQETDGCAVHLRLQFGIHNATIQFQLLFVCTGDADGKIQLCFLGCTLEHVVQDLSLLFALFLRHLQQTGEACFEDSTTCFAAFHVFLFLPRRVESHCFGKSAWPCVAFSFVHVTDAFRRCFVRCTFLFLRPNRRMASHASHRGVPPRLGRRASTKLRGRCDDALVDDWRDT